MAQPRRPRLSWRRLLALLPDVLHAIVRLLLRDDRKALRLVQRRARELVNGLVAVAEISCSDVVDELALHRSFPSLAELRIGYQGNEQISDASFAQFAAATLKQLTSLTSLDLSSCWGLGAPAVSALLHTTPQLQALNLPRSGDGRCRRSCDHDQRTCCVLTLVWRPAVRRLHRQQRLPAAALSLPADGADRCEERRVPGPAAPERAQPPTRAQPAWLQQHQR
jgi:hypothetical protein